MTSDTAFIPLNRRGLPPLECLVDASDYEWLTGFGVWHLICTGPGCYYPARSDVRTRTASGRPVLILMHRLIMGATPGQVVDHINRNKLDNRKANLRLATPSQSGMNRVVAPGESGYRGVAKSGRGAFSTRITCAGRIFRLGKFATAIEAARAYDKAAVELHGEFAVLNFPNDYAKAG